MRQTLPQLQTIAGHSCRRLFALAVVTALLAGGATAQAQVGGDVAEHDRDCFWQLIEGSDEEIRCEFPAIMTEEERGEVRRITRGVFQDAKCLVDIRVKRALVENAVATPDFVFEVPPQPVACEVRTKKSVYPITSTFAPRVVFKGGEAVEATPGMGKVVGVASLLSWPVRVWVNRSDMIEDGMLKIINAYLKRRRAGEKVREGQTAAIDSVANEDFED